MSEDSGVDTFLFSFCFLLVASAIVLKCRQPIFRSEGIRHREGYKDILALSAMFNRTGFSFRLDDFLKSVDDTDISEQKLLYELANGAYPDGIRGVLEKVVTNRWRYDLMQLSHSLKMVYYLSCLSDHQDFKTHSDDVGIVIEELLNSDENVEDPIFLKQVIDETDLPSSLREKLLQLLLEFPPGM